MVGRGTTRGTPVTQAAGAPYLAIIGSGIIDLAAALGAQGATWWYWSPMCQRGLDFAVAVHRELRAAFDSVTETMQSAGITYALG